MIDETKINAQLTDRFGGDRVSWKLSRTARANLRFREVLHVFGVHHMIHTFRWDERIERLIDEGMSCRVCGSGR